MDSFVVNVEVWILIRPELVLSIDSIEANVRRLALAVWKATYLASTVSGGTIDINT